MEESLLCGRFRAHDPKYGQESDEAEAVYDDRKSLRERQSLHDIDAEENGDAGRCNGHKSSVPSFAEPTGCMVS